MRSFLAGAAALTLMASPALAANPAASLSVAKSRAATASSNKSELAGGGIFAAVILAGIAAIGVIAIVNDSDDSDSNCSHRDVEFVGPGGHAPGPLLVSQNGVAASRPCFVGGQSLDAHAIRQHGRPSPPRRPAQGVADPCAGTDLQG
jgi:hypothetical protein